MIARWIAATSDVRTVRASIDLRQMQRRIWARGEQVLRALQRALCFSHSSSCICSHTETEPIVAAAAGRDDLREDLLGALGAAVLHQLRAKSLPTISGLSLASFQCFSRPSRRSFEADRDGPALVVLQLLFGIR